MKLVTVGGLIVEVLRTPEDVNEVEITVDNGEESLGKHVMPYKDFLEAVADENYTVDLLDKEFGD